MSSLRAAFSLIPFLAALAVFAQEPKPQPAGNVIIADDYGANACCGKKPSYPDPNYALFGPRVLVATRSGLNPNDWVVQVVDYLQAPQPANDTFWYPASPPPYRNPQWTVANLGDVFGVTLDSTGNIYTAAARVHSTVGNVTWGIGGAGKIYKLANGSGAVIQWATIPAGQAGVGNVAWSCAYNSLYASNFDDGKIYRLNAAGVIAGTWDHGLHRFNAPMAPTVTGGPPTDPNLADGGTEPYGFTQLGRRVWAVQPYNGRLYYSVWWEDKGNPNPSKSNEIWSVALTSIGLFAGSPRLEIRVPPWPQGSNTWSSPVSDISFSSTGYMLLAERTMDGAGVAAAHASRILEYRPAGGGWLPSAAVFETGTNAPLSLVFYGSNAAGGDDYDYETNGRVWATGDALNFPSYHGPKYLYGYQGAPKTGTGSGGSTLNSVLIDDDNVSAITKYMQGDLEITCPQCESFTIGPITGPTNTCSLAAQYCVTPQPGVVYQWTVSGGTASSLTGPCITVNWSSTGSPGTVSVTGTKTYGCETASATLSAAPCQPECCHGVVITAPRQSHQIGLNGAMTFTPKVSASMPNVVRVTAELLTTSLSYSPSTCAAPAPANSYFLSGGAAGSFTPQAINPPNGREVVWLSPPTTITNILFPMTIQFPLPGSCDDSVSFCIKYTFYDSNCRACSAIVCYGPYSRVVNPIAQRDQISSQER